MSTTVWEWLRHSPLTGVLLTVGAYRLALDVSRRCHGHPLANTVLVGAVLVLSGLAVTGMDVREYMIGASYLQFLLGPVTVALAIPLYHNLARLRQHGGVILISLLAGSVCGVVSAVWLGRWFGLPESIVLSLAPRSVTTPIAMGVSEAIGGMPELTAGFVIVTGIIGAVFAWPIARGLQVRDDLTLGVATGMAAHGIGTARVFQLSETAGAFAGLAMGLAGLLTALLAPWLLKHL